MNRVQQQARSMLIQQVAAAAREIRETLPYDPDTGGYTGEVTIPATPENDYYQVVITVTRTPPPPPPPLPPTARAASRLVVRHLNQTLDL